MSNTYFSVPLCVPHCNKQTLNLQSSGSATITTIFLSLVQHVWTETHLPKNIRLLPVFVKMTLIFMEDTCIIGVR